MLAARTPTRVGSAPMVQPLVCGLPGLATMLPQSQLECCVLSQHHPSRSTPLKMRIPPRPQLGPAHEPIVLFTLTFVDSMQMASSNRNASWPAVGGGLIRIYPAAPCLRPALAMHLRPASCSYLCT